MRSSRLPLLISMLFVLVVLALSGCNLGKSLSPEIAVTPSEVVAVATSAPVDLAGPQVGTQMYWADNSLLVYVPGGEFTMGSDAVLDNQKHTETLSSYWIYQNKVTNRQYELCVQAGICAPPIDPSAQKSLANADLGDTPVVSVTWDQASAYCTWIKGTLPTEAQWELAARGPNGNLYPWGDAQPACDLLNFNNCLGVTTKVDNYPAGKSFYNTLDMSGNVFEWVNDWYAPDYYKNSPAQDPMGPDSGKARVIRSSSYISKAEDVLPSKRFFQVPTKSRLDLGFRCVVEKPVVLVSACQTSGIASTGCSAVPFTGGTTAACSSTTPRVVRNTNGCNQGAGFGTIVVSGSYDLGPGGTPGCTRDSENRITCTGNGSPATVSVCDPTVLQAPPGGATACPIGYSPSPDGGCMYAGACPVGFAPGANGCEVVPPLLVPTATTCESPKVEVPGQGCVDPSACAAPKIFIPGAGCIDSPICIPPNIYIPGSGCVNPLGICELPKIMDPFRGCIDPIADIIRNCPIGFYNVSRTDPAVCLPPEPIGCAAYAVATGRNCLEDSFTRNDQPAAPQLVPTVPSGGSEQTGGQLVPPALVQYLNNPPHLPNLCPAGTYFDTGSSSCVSPSGPGQSGQTGAAAQCLAGFNYNTTAMCCQGAAYSGCPAGQALFGGTCAPIPSTGSNCTNVTVNTGTCDGSPGNGNPGGQDNPGGDPQGNPGGPGGTTPGPTCNLSLSICQSQAYWGFDPATCSCIVQP